MKLDPPVLSKKKINKLSEKQIPPQITWSTNMSPSFKIFPHMIMKTQHFATFNINILLVGICELFQAKSL